MHSEKLPLDFYLTRNKHIFHIFSKGLILFDKNRYKDGEDLQQSERISFITSEDSSVLSIRKVEESDSGMYRCISNSLSPPRRITTDCYVHVFGR